MRRISLHRLTSLAITSVMVISMTSCSAKPSTDTVETSTEAVTELETETETEEETVSPSGNDVSSNDVSETEAESEAETEEETEESPESKTNAASEEEEEIEEESTNSKTSEKDSTKSETTTSETTTEAVTVQSVSAVVNGTHYVGETLTGADFTVTVKMSDGSTLTNPAGWSAQPLTLNSTSNLITVSYEGTSTTVTVPASVQTAGTGSSSGGSTGSTSGSGTSSASGSGTSSVSGSGSTDTASATQGTTTTATTATEAAAEEIETIGEICGEGEYCYDYSYLLFQAENYVRESVGVSDMTWSNELYNVACKCAKACADAGSIDHSLTAKYRIYFIQNNYRELIDFTYDENLGHQTAPSTAVYDESIAEVAETYLRVVINSPSHYASMISDGEIEAGVGVYKKDGMLYVSYLFHHIESDKSCVDDAPDISDRYDPETWEIITYDEFIAKYKTSTNVYTY